ncbi:hypothetical protein SUGI_0681690 [Cryptomeria japonica]|nr:hypothetical protein SUGI_0681690 [Cryptomeria japonica]
MAFKREYAYFFAVMMGMAMLMAAATSVVAEGDTERSKPQRLSQNTTEAPFAVKLSKTTEMKSGASDNLPDILIRPFPALLEQSMCRIHWILEQSLSNNFMQKS